MTIHGEEFEVIFDGAHCDDDSDLLCCPEIREKRPGGSGLVRRIETNWLPQAHARRPRRTDPIYTTIQACLERQPSTAYELCQATGFSDIQVRSVISSMRDQGLLQGSMIPKSDAAHVHGWRRYHWKGAPLGPSTAKSPTFSASRAEIAKDL